jgi:phage terminase Nu1 subunit (DNA packaging protein)
LKSELGLTQQKTADFLGVSVRQVRRYTEKGMPQIGSGRQVRYGAAAFAWHRAYLTQQNQTGRAGGPLTQEQARKTQIDADRAQLKLLKEQSELVPIVWVRHKQEEAAAIITARLLAFPGKMAPLVCGMPKTSAIKGRLEAGIHELLNALKAEGKKNASRSAK